ncbi:MAG: glycosyltransferase family 4 protein [Planctomycetaceae bacterium]
MNRSSETKRLLLVYDVEGWAWHRRALDLLKSAPAGSELAAVSAAEYAALPEVELARFDALFLCSWSADPRRFAGRKVCLVANHGIEFDPWPCRLPGHGGACDHRGHDWRAVCATPRRNRREAARRLPGFDGVIALNRELAASAAQLNPRTRFLPTGIDGEVFAPRSVPRADPSQKLRVGWCGQRVAGEPNQKGYDWVLAPVRERCAGFCDFLVNARGHSEALGREEMVTWYDGIDVFLCTSISEGTPTTAMEALSCGRPVVSTAVGEMPVLVEDGRTGFLTGTYRDADSAATVIDRMCGALRRVHQDRGLLRHMGFQSRVVMRMKRNWDSLANQWLRYIAGDRSC